MTPEQAQREINKLHKSLVKWLSWRSKLALVAAGKAPGDRAYATRALAEYLPEEVAIGQKLSELFQLAGVEVRGRDGDPVRLAQLALNPQGPSPQGGVAALATWPWYTWLAIGGTLVILYTIRNIADAASEKRQLEACKAKIEGSCPFQWQKWLFYSALVAAGWYVYARTDILKLKD